MTPDLVIYLSDGPSSLESYVARVATAEIGAAAPAAVRAQAIAARTFVLRAMRDDSKLGTPQKPIPSSQRFQVAAATATARATTATSETAGIVCRYQGELTICNYVAGALWSIKGKTAEDPTATEKWVTYNEGKTGAAVKPSAISNKSRSDNRGCLSQNAADWLARKDYDHAAILRYFYGADLEIGPLAASSPSPTAPIPFPPQPTQPQPSSLAAPSSGSSSSSGSSALPILAALAVAFIGDSRS